MGYAKSSSGKRDSKYSAANNNFKPGYAAKLILKDLKIANDMAKKVSLESNMAKKLLIYIKDLQKKWK